MLRWLNSFRFEMKFNSLFLFYKCIPLNEKQNNTTPYKQFTKFNRKIVERGKIDTSNTQIHDL